MKKLFNAVDRARVGSRESQQLYNDGWMTNKWTTESLLFIVIHMLLYTRGETRYRFYREPQTTYCGVILDTRSIVVRTGRHSVKSKWHKEGEGEGPKNKTGYWRAVKGLSLYDSTCKCQPGYLNATFACSLDLRESTWNKILIFNA